MDLHFQGPAATPAQRAAVDAALLPALPHPSFTKGGNSLDANGSHAARRDLLLPALHAVQSRFGWLPPGALDYISRCLGIPPAEAYGVATFYHLLSVTALPPAVVHVCDDIACRIQGGERICSELEQKLGPPGKSSWKRSSCLGQCERAPAALVTHAGENCRSFNLPRTDSAQVLAALDTVPPIGDMDDKLASLKHSVPQAGSSGLRLIGRIGQVDPESIEAYQATGGYSALRRALELGPDAVVQEVTAAKLTGRGGAAFPTGRKWAMVARHPVRPHYLVCNADESEPGAFKDRLLMEGDPFAVLEGITIAGYATGCEHSYLYLRGEYPLAAERMETAIRCARAAGLLGRNVCEAGVAFDVEIRRGAGAYICGEETALFNSIEGKRGEPRNKPPFPVDAGLFGKPTVVNNVETLVNIPPIVLHGGAAYAGIGTSTSTGTKLFCVSGQVVRPGLYELPFGSTIREVIALAGGVSTGRPIRAVLLGGAAGSFVGPDKLDTPLTHEATRAMGASIGSGVIMVFDDGVDLGDILARIAAFFRDESCGQCVPCRVGTVRQEELLQRLRSGRPIGSPAQELALLQEIAQAMRDASICGLGQTAANALQSAFATLNPLGEKGSLS